MSNLMASNDDLEDYIAMFKQMDKSHDGFLSYDELKKELLRMTDDYNETTEDDWEEILAVMDSNNDGKIDFTEFVAAAYDRQKLLNKKNIKIAFDMFDVDGDGQISNEEFQKALGQVNPNTEELKTLQEQW